MFLQFNKEDGKVVEESKLGVVYIPANPPSPVLEESEEGSSPRASVLENDDQDSSLFEDVSFFFSPCCICFCEDIHICAQGLP